MTTLSLFISTHSRIFARLRWVSVFPEWTIAGNGWSCSEHERMVRGFPHCLSEWTNDWLDSSGKAVVSGWGWCDPGFGRALSACNGCSKRLAFPQTPSADESVLGESRRQLGCAPGKGRSVGSPLA